MNHIHQAIPPLTLVKAGAGAGKTYLIQKTLVDWVLEKGLSPRSILAVTFTNAAAAEMRERIRTSLIKESQSTKQAIDLDGLDQAQITTIHGFGLAIIERFSYEKGLTPKPRQLTEAEKNHLIKQAVASLAVIESVTQRLDEYGYSGTFKKDKFISKSDQFRGHLLAVIDRLRSLGKGSDDSAETQRLLSLAQARIGELYGSYLANAETLTSDLMVAIIALKGQCSDKNQMLEAIGFNKELRELVSAVYKANVEKLNTDWKIWVKLQGKETKKLDKHPFSSYVNAVMLAASKLSVHPGPYQQALAQVQVLIDGANQALAAYQQGKTEAGLVDFSDMVQMANAILADDACFAEIRQEVGCLIIDEFQDTNPLQFTLLRRFQQAGVPTFIVGDLKQSIMGFQGADSRLFASLLERAKDNEKQELTNNWRSSTGVMTFINAMGKQLYGDVYTPLTPSAKHKDQSTLTAVRRVLFHADKWLLKSHAKSDKLVFNQEGYAYLVNEIRTLVASGVLITDKVTEQQRPIAYKDIAVLAPSHSQLKNFAARLRAVGIQAQLLEEGWFASDGVQWLLHALQYLNNDTDYFAALNVITSPFVQAELNQALVEFFAEKRFNHGVIQQLDALRERYLSAGGRVLDLPIRAQLIHLMECLDLDAVLANLEEGEQQRANVIKLLGLAESFAQLPEASLHAMGIFGKNANTFRLWLTEIQQEDDRQPVANTQGRDAVVLMTWHASKGLEWPVVMVLGAHQQRKADLASISLSYPSSDINQMLQEGFVEFLPQMSDSKTKEKFIAALNDEVVTTQKNLIYVALTRAREQIILPWYVGKDGHKDNSLCGYLDAVFETPTENLKFLDTTAGVIDTSDEVLIKSRSQQLVIHANRLPETIAAATSPSGHEESEAEAIETESHTYGKGLALSELDAHCAANDIGTWMHRLYQVAIMQPSRLEDAMRMPPVGNKLVISDVLKQAIITELNAFKAWMQTHWRPISYQCELPTLSINELGQTVSGTIDLLVETEQGYWIVDHKTDKEAVFAKHYPQLMAYSEALKLDKPVLGVAVNWVRTSILTANLEFV